MTEEGSSYQVKTIQCPVCDSEKASFITHILDIPHYSDFLMINVNCKACGYRTTDFENIKSKGYAKYVYIVDTIHDDSTKVVRSKEGVFSIPELEIVIEPVGDGNSWIRNIEGILLDIKSKLAIMAVEMRTTEEILTINQRIMLCNELLEYKRPFTIIIEDKTGNSMILPADESKLVITYET